MVDYKKKLSTKFGKTYAEIIQEFPDLTHEHIAACLDYARELSEYTLAA